MKREIKFRAWDSVSNKMLNYVNILGIDEGFAYGRSRAWIHNSTEWEEDESFIENPVLMQYTGLKDKNNKEIFESDIIRIYENNNGYFEVVFENGYQGGWNLKHSDEHKTISLGARKSENIEIIGNIYENTELLKVCV